MKNNLRNSIFLMLFLISGFITSYGQLNCNTNLFVSLSNDGIAKVYAESFVEGNPGDVEVMRENGTWGPFVLFDCDDLESPVEVTAMNSDGDMCATVVTIEDKLKPVPYALNGVVVSLDSSGSVTITPEQLDLGSYDNCGIESMTLDQSTFTEPGYYTVQLTVEDASGNSDYAFSSVTVLDMNGGLPLVCINLATVLLSSDPFGGTDLYAVDFVLNGDEFDSVLMSLDENGPFTSTINVDCDPEEFTLYLKGILNSVESNCYTEVTVIDDLPPVAISNANICIELENGSASLTAEDVDNGSYDLCSGVSLSIDQTDFTIADLGTNFVTLTVTDESGNTNTVWSEVVVTVSTQLDPFIICPSDITISCADDYEDTVITGIAYANESCDILEVEYEDIVVSINSDQEGFVTREWTVVDFPNVTCVQNITITCDPEDCGIAAFNLPDDLTISDPDASQNEIHPLQLMANYGYTEDQVFLNAPEPCINLVVSWSDQVFTTTYGFKVLRSWTGLDWLSLEIIEHHQVLKFYTDGNASLACNSDFEVAVSEGNSFVVTPSFIVEGYSGSYDNLVLELMAEDSTIVPNNEITVDYLDQIIIVTVTDTTTGNICWGAFLVVEGFPPCALDFDEDVSLPLEEIFVNAVDVDPTQLSPVTLVSTYGFDQADVSVLIDSDCALASYVYADEVIILNEDFSTVIRTFTIIDWISYDPNMDDVGIWNFTQTINVGLDPNSLICDFLPRSAPVGDCESGHTLDDDVEWPNDLEIADPRLTPEELVAFSDVAEEDAQPQYYNSPDDYEHSYLDLFVGFPTAETVEIKRHWTVEHTLYNLTFEYFQTIIIDYSDFENLVTVNTSTNRAVPNVNVNDIITDDEGFAHVDDLEVVDINYTDEGFNGLNVLDFAIVQDYLLDLITINEMEAMAADVNLDGAIHAGDLSMLLRVALKEIDEPNLWIFEKKDETIIFENQVANYLAVKRGDIDDSALIGDEVPPTPTASFKIEDQLLNAGESYSINVNMDGDFDLRGLELHFDIDTDILTVNDVTTTYGDESLSFNVTDDGELIVMFGEVNGFSVKDLETFMKIEVTANQNSLVNLAVSLEDLISYGATTDYELLVFAGEVTDVIGTGTNSPELENVSVYPNPTTDYLNIDLSSVDIVGDLAVTIYDAQGKIVRTEANNTFISVRDLPSGTHFYKITIGDYTSINPFIIAK